MTDFEGPAMSPLHNRMTAAPREIATAIDAPHLPALVHDLLYKYSTKVSAEQLASFGNVVQQSPWHLTSYLMLYFISASEFEPIAIDSTRLLHCLEHTARELHTCGKNSIYIEDLDRREEFIRVILSALGLRPQGESKIQADDRLLSVSSMERKRVIAAVKVAEERADKIRKALMEKAAREAADKVIRE